jgi:hypothetical protein
MALTLDFKNIIQFFTFLSPILISVFLLLQSALNTDMKGIVWMIGSLVSWVLAMGVKFMFSNFDKRPDGDLRPKKWQRTPIALNLPFNAGQTENNVPDYCNVFDGPFGLDDRYNTSMPSLNAVSHVFTITYLILGLSNNPYSNPGGIAFVIILLFTAFVNLAFRVQLYCDKPLDIFAGIVLGALCGFLWFYLIQATHPTWTYYGKEERKGKCVLGKQKFRCSYD